MILLSILFCFLVFVTGDGGDCEAGSGSCDVTAAVDSSDSGDVDSKPEVRQYSPLQLLVNASMVGDVDEVLRILDDASNGLSANPNKRLPPFPGEDQGLTALHGAALGGSAKIVELLVKRGADVEGDVNNRAADAPVMQTPLIAACYTNNVAAALTLLRLGASPLALNRHNTSALHLAALHGASGLVGDLLDRGAPVNVADDSGYTPLHMASLAVFPDVVRRLLAAGADPAAVDMDRRTPLHHVCGSHPPMDPDAERPLTVIQSAAQLTAAAPDTVHNRDIDGCQPIHWCASRNHNLTVEHLAAAGADINGRDADGRTPLLRAFHAQASWSAKVLLEDLGASPTVADGQGDTPVHFAARMGYTQLMGRLLTRGGSSTARTAVHLVTGNAPVHEAAASGSHEVFDVLLSVGAPLNEPNALGETPALLAARAGGLSGARILWSLRTAIVKQLPGEPGLEALKSVAAGQPADKLASPEFRASRLAAEQLALALKPKPSADDDADSSGDDESSSPPAAWVDQATDLPLLAACDRSDGRPVTVLLSFLPDLSLQNPETGDSALHRCLRSFNVAGTKELLENGAPLDLANGVGATPAGIVTGFMRTLERMQADETDGSDAAAELNDNEANGDQNAPSDGEEDTAANVDNKETDQSPPPPHPPRKWSGKQTEAVREIVKMFASTDEFVETIDLLRP